MTDFTRPTFMCRSISTDYIAVAREDLAHVRVGDAVYAVGRDGEPVFVCRVAAVINHISHVHWSALVSDRQVPPWFIAGATCIANESEVE